MKTLFLLIIVSSISVFADDCSSEAIQAAKANSTVARTLYSIQAVPSAKNYSELYDIVLVNNLNAPTRYVAYRVFMKSNCSVVSIREF